MRELFSSNDVDISFGELAEYSEYLGISAIELEYYFAESNLNIGNIYLTIMPRVDFRNLNTQLIRILSAFLKTRDVSNPYDVDAIRITNDEYCFYDW